MLGLLLDCLLAIFQFLDDQDFLKLSQLNKEWLGFFTNRPELWTRRTLMRWKTNRRLKRHTVRSRQAYLKLLRILHICSSRTSQL